jgi:hypothetical protein
MVHGAAQLDAALARLVSADGRVDYAALESDGSALACARDLARFDLTALRSREQQLAFWINAYNCLVLAGVLERLGPNPSYRGVMHDGWAGALRFFYLDRHVIGGRKLSLATIENRILRGKLREPRIHFALVCAARSCPRLKHGLYSAEHIEAELEMAAQQFIRSPDGVRLEREARTVWLSRIFKWYRKDFERAAGSVLGYVARYLNEDERDYLDRHGTDLRIRFFDYDWQLNRQFTRPIVE